MNKWWQSMPARLCSLLAAGLLLLAVTSDIFAGGGAPFASPLYTVQYFANGGTAQHGDPYVEAVEEDPYSVLGAGTAGFSKGGYLFAGWNTKPGGDGQFLLPGDSLDVSMLPADRDGVTVIEAVYQPGTEKTGTGAVTITEAQATDEIHVVVDLLRFLEEGIYQYPGLEARSVLAVNNQSGRDYGFETLAVADLNLHIDDANRNAEPDLYPPGDAGDAKIYDNFTGKILRLLFGDMKAYYAAYANSTVDVSGIFGTIASASSENLSIGFDIDGPNAGNTFMDASFSLTATLVFRAKDAGAVPNLNLYAQWMDIHDLDMAVHYHANGGAGSSTPYTHSVANASAYTALSRNTVGFTRQNHSFVHWNTKADGTGVAVAPSDVLDLVEMLALANQIPGAGKYVVHLYAIWDRVPVTTTSSEIIRPTTSRPVEPETTSIQPAEISSPGDSSGTTGGTPGPGGEATATSGGTGTTSAPGGGTGPATTSSSSSSPAISSSSSAVPSSEIPSSSQPEEIVDVEPEEPPVALPGLGGWSLVSLLLSILALLTSIILAIRLLLYRSDKEPEEGEENERPAGEHTQVEEETGQGKKRRLLGFVTAVVGVVPLILFLILDDLRMPMVMVNRWTPLVAIVAILFFGMILVRWLLTKKQDDTAPGDKPSQYT